MTVATASTATPNDLFLQKHAELTVDPGEGFRQHLEGPPPTWPDQVLSIATAQHPYIADYPSQVKFLRLDPDGFGVGYIEVMTQVGAKEGTIKVPIVVRDQELLEMSIFLHGERAYPLTEERFRTALLDQPVGRVVSEKDQSIPEEIMRDQELEPANHLSGFGNRAIMSKLSAVRDSDVDAVRAAVQSIIDARFDPVRLQLESLLEKKAASKSVPYRTVMLLPENSPNRFPLYVKYAHDDLPKDHLVQATLKRAQAKQLAGEHFQALEREGKPFLHSRVEKRAGLKQALNLQIANPATEYAQQATGGTDFHSGTYRVMTKTGLPLVGSVYDQVMSLDGTRLPLMIFTDGTRMGIHESIAGEIVNPQATLYWATPDDIASMGKVELGLASSGMQPMATPEVSIPFVVMGQLENGLMVETYLGERLTLMLNQPVQILSQADEHTVLVPSNWRLVRYGAPESRVDLMELNDGYNDLNKVGQRVLRIKSDGIEYDIHGKTVRYDNLNKTAALFRLTDLGVIEPDRVLKIAARRGAVDLYGKLPDPPADSTWAKRAEMYFDKMRLPVEQAVKLASFLSLPWSKSAEYKQASDPATVDHALSLGFVRPENTETYVRSLDDLEESAQKLASLLLAGQLGYSEIPVSAAKTAMQAIDRVIAGLKRLQVAGDATRV